MGANSGSGCSFRSTVQEKEKDLTSEVPTKFSKLSGWRPVTEFCSNFGCPNLFLSFWTEIVFFGTEIGSKEKRLFVFLLGTGSVFSKVVTVD